MFYPLIGLFAYTNWILQVLTSRFRGAWIKRQDIWIINEAIFKPWPLTKRERKSTWRKLTCDDTSQTAAQVRWYISYDSFKRCLKDTFLLPLWTCIFPSLTPPPPNLALAGLVLLLSLWVLLRFKTTSTSSEAAMFNFDTKYFLIDSCFVFKQLTSLRKVERNLRWNLNKLELVASWCKPPQVGSQTRHKQKIWDDLRSRTIKG